MRSERTENWGNRRNINTVYERTYEHEPANRYRQRQGRGMNTPLIGNKVYDCNDIDHIDNLSFEFRSNS